MLRAVGGIRTPQFLPVEPGDIVSQDHCRVGFILELTCGFVVGMEKFGAFLPSQEWQTPRVHWHAYVEVREQVSDRAVRWKRRPDSVLRTPWEVATWIDEHTRAHVHHREVWVAQERDWVAIGDEDDLAHLRQENFAIASRGDSIHTDIYTDATHHDLYVEAVTDDQCLHRCAT